MTNHLISDVQIGYLLRHGKLLLDQKEMLQSLPELTREPVAWRYKYDTDINKGVWGVGYNVPKNSTEYHPLYTSHQPLNERMVTHAEGCHTWGSAHYECAKRRITELEAQLADAQKDAARYQWLRNDSSSSYIGIYRDPHSNCRRYLFSAEADTFIDAAMQPKEQV